MKYFALFLLTAAAWAQSPTPPSPAPTTSPAVAPSNSGPRPAAPVSPATVIATFDNDKKITLGVLNALLAVVPQNMAEAAQRNRKGFVEQFAVMVHLAEMAEKAKLDEYSPTREALAFQRLSVLMNAQLRQVVAGLQIPPADLETYYNANKDRFKQVKAKALFVAFSADPAAPAATNEPKHPTAAEAQAKIERLRTAIVGGADFGKMVQENSDDKVSAFKNGDIATIHSTDKLPDALRKAIFALKTGEVSEPVKQPNGFYLFRAEEVSAQPFADVQGPILEEMKQAQFDKWMNGVVHDVNLKIESDAFFTEGGQPPAGR